MTNIDLDFNFNHNLTIPFPLFYPFLTVLYHVNQ